MFVKRVMIISSVSLIGCASPVPTPKPRAEPIAIQPAAVQASEPEVELEPKNDKKPIVAPPTEIAEELIVTASDSLVGRWELKMMLNGVTPHLPKDDYERPRLTVHFCEDGRVKLQSESFTERFDTYHFDSGSNSWQVLLRKRNKKARLLAMRFVDNDPDIVEFAQFEICPANKRCFSRSWESIESRNVEVNRMHRSKKAPKC